MYVAIDVEGFAGCFFPNEIVPAPTTEHHDTPEFTAIEKWKDSAELEEFLRVALYCWQLYPVRMPHDRFCGPVHRAEIEAQRRATALPGA